MAEEIKIVASAVGFDQVDKALNNTAKGFNEVTASAKKTGDTLSKEMKNGSNQATQSLSNLSRVAQDAPYGFIGIANNINPLLESFQRLKAETGSTGGALKALVSGLTGPAGIGLAVGVISSLLVTFSQSAGKAKSELDPLVKANEEFNKSLDDAKKGALTTGLQLQAYVDIAKNGQLPLEQRNEALKQANDILGKHGEQLTLTNIGTSKATEQVRLYTQAIIAQAVATKYADRLADLAIQKTNKLNEIKTQDLYIERLRLTNSKSQINSLTGQTAGYNQLGGALIELENKKSDLATLDSQYNQTLTNLNNTVLQSTSAFGTLGYKTKEVKEQTKKAKKELETFDQTIIKTLGDLQDQQQIAIAIDTSTIDEQIKIVKAEIARGIKEFNLPANDQRIIVLGVKLNELEAQKALDEIDLNVKIPKVDITLPEDKELLKKMADFQNILTQYATDTAVQLGSLLGEGLYSAISGQTDGLMAAFGGLFSLFGDAVVNLGKYAIMYSSAMEALKKAIAGASGLAGIGIGIGLIALGTLIKKATAGIGKKGSFAVGTRNAPGGMALVGERGPELINLPKGSQVIPAAQTSNMMGAMQSIEVFGMLKGKDIYFSNKNYSKTYSTTT